MFGDHKLPYTRCRIKATGVGQIWHQVGFSQLPWKAMNFKTMQMVASSLQDNTPHAKDLMRKQKKCLFDRYVFSRFILF